jgi:hypothetical protein
MSKFILNINIYSNIEIRSISFRYKILIDRTRNLC